MAYEYPPPAAQTPPPAIGLMWIIAAVAAWTLNAFLWGITALTSGWGRDCSSASGSLDVPPGCPREGLSALAALMVLGVWVVFTGISAIVVGVIEGRYRRFAYERRTCAVLVTLAMPWAVVGYAVGNAMGRLLPRPVYDPSYR